MKKTCKKPTDFFVNPTNRRTSSTYESSIFQMSSTMAVSKSAKLSTDHDSSFFYGKNSDPTEVKSTKHQFKLFIP